MRGKALQGLHAHEQKGITPAHAGKRPMMDSSAFSTKDHPCVCGEKLSLTSMTRWLLGSPLRVRGKDHFERLL